ncbi:MAG TPA: lysylphosphatidylglycerol synthase transmembrane domain-containing protein [Anaerolineales bacterium]|nr:lysylphosphatidylglycerol synthase transmembrane domain-containing protein [Anaerolineales bacterium]
MRRWQFWLGVAFSLVLLTLAMRRLRLEDVWQALRSAEFIWLLPGVAVYFLGVWARAWRWHYLLRPLQRIPVGRMFPVVAIGYMGNNIYPARAGELLRAYVLRRKYSVPISASLATIIVERAFDGIVMLGFVFLNLPELISLTGESGFAGSIRDLALWGAAAFLAATVVFLVLAAFPRQARVASGWLIDRLAPARARPAATGMAERFLEGLAALRSPADVLMVLVTSVVIWLLETGKYWFVMHAFPFQVSFFALMLMNGIVNLATTLPSAPGYVGTFDAPGIAVLTAYGVQPEIAAGYTLLLHAALWLPITLLGAYYMARESLSWGAVRAELQPEART